MPLRNMFFCLLVVISIVGVVGCLADIESVRVDETLIGYKGQIIEKTQITEIDKERRYAMERASTNREFAGPVGDIFMAFWGSIIASSLWYPYLHIKIFRFEIPSAPNSTLGFHNLTITRIV